jgi:hypothetical protein
LAALAEARSYVAFDCSVCDSSQDPETRRAIRSVVDDFEFAKYFYHTGTNVAAARNFCSSVATGDLLVNVDDDVCVEPQSIKRLQDHYFALENKDAIIGGSVKFGDHFSRPVVMRPIGYGRSARDGELFDFIIGAFMLYPRHIWQRYPWNERLKTSDDRFMGALWRRVGVKMHFLESAKAIHDVDLNSYDVSHQRSHIYANLFDAIFARKSLYWFFCFEFVGFAAGARKYLRNRNERWRYVQSWLLGNRDLLRDWNFLKNLSKSKVL